MHAAMLQYLKQQFWSLHQLLDAAIFTAQFSLDICERLSGMAPGP